MAFQVEVFPPALPGGARDETLDLSAITAGALPLSHSPSPDCWNAWLFSGFAPLLPMPEELLQVVHDFWVHQHQGTDHWVLSHSSLHSIDLLRIT